MFLEIMYWYTIGFVLSIVTTFVYGYILDTLLTKDGVFEIMLYKQDWKHITFIATLS